MKIYHESQNKYELTLVFIKRYPNILFVLDIYVNVKNSGLFSIILYVKVVVETSYNWKVQRVLLTDWVKFVEAHSDVLPCSFVYGIDWTPTRMNTTKAAPVKKCSASFRSAVPAPKTLLEIFSNLNKLMSAFVCRSDKRGNGENRSTKQD